MAVASVGAAHPAPKPAPTKIVHPRPQPPKSLSGQSATKAHPLIGKPGSHVNKLV